MSDVKSTNPKDAIGVNKLPLHLVPSSLRAYAAIALANGAFKYGRENYRESGVRASVYYDALNRHMDLWWSGEQVDEEGVPHLASAAACLAIMIDAYENGMLTEDRAYLNKFPQTLKDVTPHISRLRELHKDKHPRHYDFMDVIDCSASSHSSS